MDDGVSVDDLLENVKSFLTSHNTISIASVDEKEVSAASVFYVSDIDLKIYFLSFDKTLHSQHIFQNLSLIHI